MAMSEKAKETKLTLQDKLRHDEHYSTQIDLIVSLRNLCGLSAAEVAFHLEIERCTLSRYEGMKSTISTFLFNKALAFYHDYLNEHHIEKEEHILKLERFCLSIYL